MKPQAVKIRGEKTPFAVRFFLQDSQPQPIKPGGGIGVIPEFGGIIYNRERCDGLAVKPPEKLPKPVKLGSV